MRGNDHRSGHVCARNTSQQRSLANGDLETRRRGLDLRQERVPPLDVDGRAGPCNPH